MDWVNILLFGIIGLCVFLLGIVILAAIFDPTAFEDCTFIPAGKGMIAMCE